MKLTTVTIGRNIGNRPMSDDSWNSFQQAVVRILRENGTQVFGPFTGTGEWDGVTEESAVITGLTDDALRFGTIGLNSSLRALASAYHQDAIAWSFADSNLATPVQ